MSGSLSNWGWSGGGLALMAGAVAWWGGRPNLEEKILNALLAEPLYPRRRVACRSCQIRRAGNSSKNPPTLHSRLVIGKVAGNVATRSRRSIWRSFRHTSPLAFLARRPVISLGKAV